MTHEDQIIARAHQNVQARRAAQRQSTLRRSTLLLALVPLTLGGFLAAPGAVPRKLLLLMGGVC